MRVPLLRAPAQPEICGFVILITGYEIKGGSSRDVIQKKVFILPAQTWLLAPPATPLITTLGSQRETTPEGGWDVQAF